MEDYRDPLEEFIPTTPREMAEQIRDEYVEGANTAERVGNCIIAMLDENEHILEQTTHFMEDTSEKVDEKLAEVEQAKTATVQATAEATKQANYAQQMAEKASAGGDKANAFAEKAGAKADLANIKAKLADEKAQLAEQKANLADEKAQLANTNAQLAQGATDRANSASADAEKVNAQLNGNVVTITDRTGQSKSVDLGGNVKVADVTSFKTKYFIEDGKTTLSLNNSISTAIAFYDYYGAFTPIETRYRIDLMKKESWTSPRELPTTNTFTLMVAVDSQYKRYIYVGQVVTDKDGIVQSLTDADGASVSSIGYVTESEWGKIIKSLFNPTTDIADNLTTDDAKKALSAKQGKVLDEKLSELKEEVDNIEGASAEEMRMYLPMGDIEKMPTRCGQPIELYGEGTPQEAIVPYNWNQLDIETGEGHMWNGLPVFEGQRYINVNATSRALYIGIKTSLKKDDVNHYTLKWFNV